MREAVHFGAGNIGRGFLGQLYFESGLHTVFVDVVDAVVDALHARGEYPLRLVSNDACETRTISNVDAVSGRDAEAVAAVLARAEIVSTAVGVNVLERIAPVLAKGIEQRFAQLDAAPLNIIVCENLIDAGPFLREKVRAALRPEFHNALDTSVGFVEASIGRMVPVMTEAQKAEDLLLVCVEPYCELPVDGEAFRGPIPGIAHMKPRSNFKAYVARKLFVHNMTHAATAYLGYLRGHEYIWQAIGDPCVREIVEGAGRESCRALHAKHGLDLVELEAHVADLVYRYHNRALGDQVARVGRDPWRKLSPNDRLIGALRLCFDQGVEAKCLPLAAAAALRYDDPSDPDAGRVQDIRKTQGDSAVLQAVCGVPEETPQAVAEAVLEACGRLDGGMLVGQAARDKPLTD